MPDNSHGFLVVKRDLPPRVWRKTYEDIYEDILKQMKQGLVILPYYCEPMYVPPETVVRVDNHAKISDGKHDL